MMPTIMLRPLTKPGLFVTGTDTGVGKSVVASAIAEHLRRTVGLRVGAIKPIASGCEQRDGVIVNEDAERLSAAIGHRFTRDVICPQEFFENLTPAVASKIEGRAVDWPRIQQAIDAIEAESDVIVIEGVGGLYAPLDEGIAVIDVIIALGAPALCVSRPTLGTINHTLLTIAAMRQRGVACAGVVVNRVPANAGLVERTNIEQIERWTRMPVRCVVPEAYFVGYAVPPEVARAIDAVDWRVLCDAPPHAELRAGVVTSRA